MSNDDLSPNSRLTTDAPPGVAPLAASGAETSVADAPLNGPQTGAKGWRRTIFVWSTALVVVTLAVLGWRTLSPAGKPDAAPSGEVVHLGTDGPELPSGGLKGIEIVGRAAPPAPFVAFDGTHAKVSDYIGTPVVVNFWASSCTPCITEMPEFEKVHQQFGARVVFLGIDTVDGETPARALAIRTGVTYRLGFDPDGSIAKSFGVVNLPTTVMIGRDGKVVYSNGIARTADALTTQINENLHP